MQQNVIGSVGVTLPVGEPAVAAPHVPVAPLSVYFMAMVPTDDVQTMGAALVAVGAPLHVVLLHMLTVGALHVTADAAPQAPHAVQSRESDAPP
jgi:hypothetical protein